MKESKIMVKCSNCGLIGSMNDRDKFMQHGYPRNGTIRLSCMSCKSDGIVNTFWENFFFYLQSAILLIIFFPCLVFLIPEVLRWRKANNG